MADRGPLIQEQEKSGMIRITEELLKVNPDTTLQEAMKACGFTGVTWSFSAAIWKVARSRQGLTGHKPPGPGKPTTRAERGTSLTPEGLIEGGREPSMDLKSVIGRILVFRNGPRSRVVIDLDLPNSEAAALVEDARNLTTDYIMGANEA